MKFNQLPTDILTMIYEMKEEKEKEEREIKYNKSKYNFMIKELKELQKDAIRETEIWKDRTFIENILIIIEPEDDIESLPFLHSIKYEDTLELLTTNQ